ncbi:MAG: putative Ig domain-containing protein [Thermodesulfovibrionales bacterium]|nr:putative Ig domain-containing protein [Thermodesulfovibrionales bacterium]
MNTDKLKYKDDTKPAPPRCMSIHNFLICIIALFFLLSCSKEKAVDTDKQKPEIAPAPVSAVYSVEIAPSDASRNSTLNLILKGFNLSDAKIVWLVNGNPVVSETPSQFKAIETKKGDMIQAKAIVQGKEIFSNIVKIKNAPPGISRVKILPEVLRPGDALYVEAIGTDIDGDEISIAYEWTKNGEPAGRGKQIEAALKRGDKVSVRITPYDGEVHGVPAVLHREIVNMPPVIIEHRRFNFDGSVFTYQVKAKDPDNDTLAYSLKTAPSGMTIEKTTGLIQWIVLQDFKGKAEVVVVVSDGHGGEALQSFVFEIAPEK